MLRLVSITVTLALSVAVASADSTTPAQTPAPAQKVAPKVVAPPFHAPLQNVQPKMDEFKGVLGKAAKYGENNDWAALPAQGLEVLKECTVEFRKVAAEVSSLIKANDSEGKRMAANLVTRADGMYNAVKRAHGASGDALKTEITSAKEWFAKFTTTRSNLLKHNPTTVIAPK